MSTHNNQSKKYWKGAIKRLNEDREAAKEAAAAIYKSRVPRHLPAAEQREREEWKKKWEQMRRVQTNTGEPSLSPSDTLIMAEKLVNWYGDDDAMKIANKLLEEVQGLESAAGHRRRKTHKRKRSNKRKTHNRPSKHRMRRRKFRKRSRSR